MNETKTNDTKMPSAQQLMKEHADATLIARLYLMFAKAQELEREIEELKKIRTPTIMVETRGGVPYIGAHGLVDVLAVDYDNLEQSLGLAEADESVASDVADMREWAALVGNKELAAQADKYEMTHKELKIVSSKRKEEGG